MQTFGPKRLSLVQWDGLGIGLVCHRNVIFPLDGVRIKEQFILFIHIIEDRHFAVTHHNQLLLFKGMEPGNKDMRFHATGKRQQTGGDICDLLMKVVAPLRLHSVGHLSQQPQDDRKVMGGERPQNIFFAADFSQVETVRIDVLDAAKFSSVDQFLEFENRGVVPQQMSDHEDSLLLTGQCDQLLPFLHGKA